MKDFTLRPIIPLSMYIRAAKQAMEMNNAIINTISGGYPKRSTMYENGRFRNRIPPTTIWYFLIFPVASIAVTNGDEIDSCIDTNRISCTKIIEWSG